LGVFSFTFISGAVTSIMQLYDVGQTDKKKKDTIITALNKEFNFEDKLFG
jgi:hypothetical protein